MANAIAGNQTPTNTDTKAAPKRIIICCDGTWQSSVGTKRNVPSNVTRIARYLAKTGRDDTGQVWQQIVYYDAGVGTGLSKFEDVREGATGLGFNGNIIEAYNFLVLNYNPGDQIFCFGFSRGAYAARSIAGLITDIGIIQPRDMQDFPELYQIYSHHNADQPFRASKAWRDWLSGKHGSRSSSDKPRHDNRTHSAAPESSRWVEVVGVFDTVGSLGAPYINGPLGRLVKRLGKHLPQEEFGFHNVALSPFIKNAYHALALDEHRRNFTPTMWSLPAKEAVEKIRPQRTSSELKETWQELFKSADASEEQLSKAWEELTNAQAFDELKESKSRLLQVWFPGGHINTGGGNSDLFDNNGKDSDFEQLSMITLTWMIEQLRGHLSFDTEFATACIEDRHALIQPSMFDVIHERKQDHWLTRRIDESLPKYTSGTRQAEASDSYKAQAEATAHTILQEWGTGPITDAIQGMNKRGGSTYRTPGRYQHSDNTKPSGNAKLEIQAASGATNEYIHPTIEHRMRQLEHKYRPEPLIGFTRQACQDHKGAPGHQWVKADIVIPEWKIGNVDSFERICVVHEAAKRFLRELDFYHA